MFFSYVHGHSFNAFLWPWLKAPQSNASSSANRHFLWILKCIECHENHIFLLLTLLSSWLWKMRRRRFYLSIHSPQIVDTFIMQFSISLRNLAFQLFNCDHCRLFSHLIVASSEMQQTSKIIYWTIFSIGCYAQKLD